MNAPARNSTVRAWICLFIAIATEVLGTSFMAESARDGGYAGYLAMAAALSMSYYFLALSVRHIRVGIAYAVADDPFTAVMEADKWLRENVDKAT